MATAEVGKSPLGEVEREHMAVTERIEEISKFRLADDAESEERDGRVRLARVFTDFNIESSLRWGTFGELGEVEDGITYTGGGTSPGFLNEVGPYLFGDFLVAALANGTFQPSPPPKIVGKGLESIQAGLDAYKASGVSGEKLVINVL